MNFGLFSAFDLVIILILVVLNLVFLKTKNSKAFGWIITFLFLIGLPYLSQRLEVNRVYRTEETVDSFNLFYTYFKYPFYWVVGILQLIIFWIKAKNEISADDYEKRIEEIGNS
ncbi:MAG: hypothetical protein AAF824_07290 [Bacteroidota bacterium]